MGRLSNLANRLEKLAGDLPELGNKRKIAVALAVQDQLTRDTPADTSEAVSNWILSKGTRYTGKIAAYFKGKEGSTKEESAAAARLQGQQVGRRTKPGESLFLTNNTPQIVFLDEGSSEQAPAGFIKKAFATARRIAKKAK